MFVLRFYLHRSKVVLKAVVSMRSRWTLEKVLANCVEYLNIPIAVGTCRHFLFTSPLERDETFCSANLFGQVKRFLYETVIIKYMLSLYSRPMTFVF